MGSFQHFGLNYESKGFFEKNDLMVIPLRRIKPKKEQTDFSSDLSFHQSFLWKKIGLQGDQAVE